MASEPSQTGKLTVEAALERGDQLLPSEPAGAALAARSVLKSEPRNAAAHRLFAKAMSRLGHEEEASRARARAVQFSRHVPAIAHAHRATLDRHYGAVEGLLRDHLARFPDDPVALSINAQALSQLGRVNEAIRQLEEALSFMPEYAEARVALVRAHRQRFDIPAALAELEPLVKAAPLDETLIRWKASLLSNLGDNAAAAELFAALTVQQPQAAGLWINVGDEMRTMGKREQAHAAYRRAVEIAPTLGAAWWSLAALGHAPLDEADREQMRAALAASDDRAERDDRHYLHFALGTAFDQAKVFDQAFANFAAGNALLHRRQPFDPAVVRDDVERSRRLLTADFFARQASIGDPAPDPIFIVSLPRAGSTLVEQILASHPAVEGVGELPFIPILIRVMASEHGLDLNEPYHELLTRLDPAAFAAIGAEYLRLARAHRRTNKPYFLDKLPHNWADIGFIKLILPNAKVVDVRRSPMDCCWSNFRLLFAKGHPASNSLEGIAAYYRAYVEMMTHYDEALPGQVHHVVYERLVDDFEPEVRRLLYYLALPFDPAVLAFHATERTVATASAEQVRRPLNRQGIGAWRAYEEWLGPLKQAVGELEQTYADGI